MQKNNDPTPPRGRPHGSRGHPDIARRVCRRAKDSPRIQATVEKRGLLAAALISTATISCLVWWTSRRTCRFEEDRLARLRPSRICCDRRGTPIWAELGSSDRWRVPVPLSQVSPWLIAAMVAVEDRRFFEHGGVHWPAGLRALLSNLRAGRIVSGASTITMQLAKLVQPEPRSYRYKVRQILRALDIETRHDKDWILEQYLNLAPFGANLVGIEAASRAYLDKSARYLDLPEAALLAGL
ncbi:MAG: transglycosylase domain-containing protein, partial [Kiritimatiellaeota bacterium]|nr:transglycosylase domain-containing protein [Kiritimatiellota bacterium]